MSACPFRIPYDDITDPAFKDRLPGLRADAPVLELTSGDPNMCGFMITRKEDIARICMDTTTFSSVDNPQGARFGEFNDQTAAIYREKGWALKPLLVWTDPPDHGRYRKVVDRIFRTRRVDERAGHIQVCIDGAIDRFDPGGLVEAMADYAIKVPAMVMSREFSASAEDYDLLIETTNAVGASVEFTQVPPNGVQAAADAAAHAVTRFQKFMLPKIERVRAVPENTMLSDLVHARDGDAPALDMQELQSALIHFLIAATHSTAGALGWTLFMLATRQDVQARLRREPAMIEAFVEEVLRVHGTVSTSYRRATKDVELHGVTIPSGSYVLLRWDSANFDTAYWEDPENFDMERRNLKAHATFGYGPHFCVGNTLARREMVMTVQTFLTRFAIIELNGSAPPPTLLASTAIHYLNSLPLRLVPA